jgi:superfamily II DNA or RNA helicase
MRKKWPVLQRLRYHVARTVARTPTAVSVGIEVPCLAGPSLTLVDPANYRLEMEGHGAISLLKDRMQCEELHFELLKRVPSSAAPYRFSTPNTDRVSLLAKPTTHQFLEWKSPRTGTINRTEFLFNQVRHSSIGLIPKPAVTRQPLDIERASRHSFVLLIEVGNLELPCTSILPFQIRNPEQAECSDLFAQLTKVSSDLFKPLGRSSTGGKNYSRTGPSKVDQGAFSFGEQGSRKNGSSQNGYRKSFKEIRNSDGSTTRQTMTPWDLILPLLQPPPFDLTTQQQVLLPAELLPHQPQGVEFLASHEAALLGDGVQTGKTIQTIVAMKFLFQLGKINSALIVCPIPLLIHWQKQLEKWAPELWQGLTVVRSGPDRRRIMWQMPAHIYATNYETLVSDFEQIQSIRGGRGFDLIVADEVQKIKNRKGGFQQLRDLGKQGKCRWGLSATPVENAVEDLVSIFEFLKPGLLRRGFENEHSAKAKIQPFFLRRRTADVAKHFKEPRHDNHFVKMEGRQLEAYERAFNESIADLRKLGERITLADALAKLQALKRICNADLPSGESAKLEWLLNTIEEIKESGDKALVFTQYKESGRDFLSRRLERFGCVTYDSEGSDTQKQKWIKSFVEDSEKTVFLANPKVAGVGLPDLKVANYVIHFDHWWNPAVEDQANGRILGIGQKKDAFISHLWVENSVEGKIQTILARKRDLFGRVIDSQSNVDGTGLTQSELFELFGLQVQPKLSSSTGGPTEPGSDSNANGPTPPPSLGIQAVGECRPAVTPQQLSPVEFEDLVARLYKALGYAVRLTPASRDGGIDVLAIRDHPTGREKLAIQCKQQEKPVGRPDLQKLLGVVASDPSFSAGVLVTTSTFSVDAKQFADQNARLKLVDKSILARLLVQNRVAVKLA